MSALSNNNNTPDAYTTTTNIMTRETWAPTPTPPAVTTTTIYQTERTFNTLTISVLASLLVLLSVLVFIIAYKLMRQRQYFFLTQTTRMLFNNNNSSGNATTAANTQERILRRYETVEHWLITKKIHSHDAFCTRVVCGIIPQSPSQQQEAEKKDLESGTATTVSSSSATTTTTTTTETNNDAAFLSSGLAAPSTTTTPAAASSCRRHAGCSSSSSHNNGDCEAAATTCSNSSSSCNKRLQLQRQDTLTDDECDSLFDNDDDKECPICMNAFDTGDIVSWSANPECSHVYHHECIKEWLLRRTCCPFCRSTFLPCDELRDNNNNANAAAATLQEKKLTPAEQLRELSKSYSSRSSTLYYCLTDGLIQLPPMVRCTLQELEELKRRIFDSTVKPADLVHLRGERKEGSGQGSVLLSQNKDTTAANDDELLAIEDASENPCLDNDGEESIVVETVPNDPGYARVTLSSPSSSSSSTRSSRSVISSFPATSSLLPPPPDLQETTTNDTLLDNDNDESDTDESRSTMCEIQNGSADKQEEEEEQLDTCPDVPEEEV